IKTRLIRFGVV
ncbi:hypothetical protein CP02DC23_1118, partial [Chlamydia psittaci 02DC23]